MLFRSLDQDVDRYVMHELSIPRGKLKCDYYSICESDGIEIMETNREITEQLVRKNRIKARAYSDEGFYRFDQC